MIDPKIYTFHTLYETLNYHETALRLNMSQPAVTQHIKALENEYRCRLFSYDHRKLSATDAAHMLEQYAKSAVYNERMLRNALSQPLIHCFHIGTTKSIGEYMIGDMLAAFLSDPVYSADVTVDNTEKLLHMLDNNELDFAIVEGSFDKVRYGYSLFRKESLTGICSCSHRFASKTVPIEEVLRETLIVREKGSGTRDILEDNLAGIGYCLKNFSRIATVSEFRLLCYLVSHGTGVSLVYSSVAKGEDQIAEFTINEISPVHELNFVYLKNTNAENIIRKFTGIF